MEIEVKLTGASEELFRSVGESLGPYRLVPANRKQIVDVYYDTPARELMARGVSLRRREENGVALYTLKALDSYASGVVRREEEEVEATPANWQMLLAKAGATSPLEPVLTIRTDRAKRLVARDGQTVATAAFDSVDYGGGHRFWDIEFELADGADEIHLRNLAAYLPGLTATAEDKLQRGLRVTGQR